MGFLNQSMAQIRDLFASMTPAARITAALLLGVIGVSLAYLFQDFRGGSKEFLFNGQSMELAEANAIEGAFAAARLSDFERDGLNRISVPRGQKADYLAAIADGGAMPANLDTLLLDETADLGWFVDRKTADERRKAARERMLSMIIRKMDGISEANVLFDTREQKGFGKPLVTASISVRPAPGQALPSHRLKMIRSFVASAMAGLDANNVAILNLADNSQFDESAMLEPDSFEERYFQEKTRYEQLMKTRIEDLLRYIPGVRVQVTAELDETLSVESRALSSQGEPQTIREQTDTTQITDNQAEDRGRPGPTANGPGRAPPETAVAQADHTTQTDERETQNFVPTTEEVQTRSGLVPKHVRATIAIPSDFLVSVWRARNPTAPADQGPNQSDLDLIAKNHEDSIKRTVSNLFPPEVGQDGWPNVQLSVYQSLASDPIEPPTRMSEALMWASSNSGSLIMGGLAMVSLVMLRSMVKSIPASETNVILQAGAASGGTRDSQGNPEMSDFDEETGAKRPGPGGGPSGERAGTTRSGGKTRPKLRLKKGPSLKDDLTEMVREDPDAAAAILRTWISNAS
jgi:flagellar M-ring protein FliF